LAFTSLHIPKNIKSGEYRTPKDLLYIVGKLFFFMSVNAGISKKRLAAYLSSILALAVVVCQIIGDLNV